MVSELVQPFPLFELLLTQPPAQLKLVGELLLLELLLTLAAAWLLDQRLALQQLEQLGLLAVEEV